MNKPIHVKECFLNFFIFNLAFFLLQLVYIYFSESSFIHAISYPAAVYTELLQALAIQIVLYVILSCCQTALLWGMAPFFHEKKTQTCWLFAIFFLSVVALVAVNCCFFPLSKFSRIFLPDIPELFFYVMMVMSLTILGLLALVSLIRLFYRMYQKPLIFGVLAGLVSLCFMVFSFSRGPERYPTLKQPNLVIIGVDSLSPSQINSTLTPNLDAFLKSSVHFKETISPLARTYSAWTTLLTGLYPLHHFARENLYPSFEIKNSASFAWNLQRMGYHTIFASDDRRFNNLGKESGFQEIIGPRIGVNDVLLGSFYDFPLSNLIINARISHWLLPYNYSNRAGHFSYYPSTFDRSLQLTLAQHKRTKPLFLAVHFTLPHWPYAWASSSPAKVTDEYDVLYWEELYHDAVHRADIQVGNLIKQLTGLGLLNNSLFLVLSDHGEVLYKKGSRITSREHYRGTLPSHFEDYLKRKTYTELEKSAGHGSDLLSPDQYHCVLGFKRFKKGVLVTKPKMVQTRVALIDIAPTIADFFHFSLKEKPDGISLSDTILNGTQPVEHRIFMLESGMLPNQSLSKKSVIEYAKTIFQVNPYNTRIEIKNDQFKKINAMKLYGLVQDNWLVALYPDDGKYISVLLNLADNSWTDNFDSKLSKSSPVKYLIVQLRRFYAHDLAVWPNVLKI